MDNWRVKGLGTANTAGEGLKEEEVVNCLWGH